MPLYPAPTKSETEICTCLKMSEQEKTLSCVAKTLLFVYASNEYSSLRYRMAWPLG